MKLSFSPLGLLIFALPMFINIAYALFPPTEQPIATAPATQWIEFVEKASRIGYLFAITFLVSYHKVSWNSVWLYLAVLFLVLYHIVWIRYFLGGREIALLNAPFCFVPMPLAIFPVLYFLCAAIWMHNPPAIILMMIFGAAHLVVSVQSFH